MDMTYNVLRRPVTQSVTEPELGRPAGTLRTRVAQPTEYGTRAPNPMTGNFKGQVWRT